VQINPDVFDSVADNALRNKKMDRQWHVLCLSSEKDEDNHQSGMVLSNQVDELAPSSATLELWSHKIEIYGSCNTSLKICSLF